jgi:hypothetical protein
MDDRQVVAVQISREPRSVIDVVARCPLGLPTVIKVPPHLDDGTPFPTTYWLTCPLASRRIGRLESAGGVKKAEALIAADPEYATRHETAMTRYRIERDSLIGPDAPVNRPSGGVGGTGRGVKCLHAHYADHAAGNLNPVGADTAALVEPLNCAMPCMREGDGSTSRNLDWREPSL